MRANSGEKDPEINAFRVDKDSELCQAGTIPYTLLQGIADWPPISNQESGIYILQAECYLGSRLSSYQYQVKLVEVYSCKCSLHVCKVAVFLPCAV